MVFGLPDQLPQPQVITKEVIKGGTKKKSLRKYPKK